MTYFGYRHGPDLPLPILCRSLSSAPTPSPFCPFAIFLSPRVALQTHAIGSPRSLLPVLAVLCRSVGRIREGHDISCVGTFADNCDSQTTMRLTHRRSIRSMTLFWHAPLPPKLPRGLLAGGRARDEGGVRHAGARWPLPPHSLSRARQRCLCPFVGVWLSVCQFGVMTSCATVPFRVCVCLSVCLCCSASCMSVSLSFYSYVCTSVNVVVCLL